MNNRKMSLTLPFKSQIKQQIDSMLHKDYQHLRQNQLTANEIQKCAFVQRTPLIKQYIEEVEVQYNIPSPLKKNPEVSLSKQNHIKIDVSMKNQHHQRNSSKISQNRPSKKLSLVTSQVSRVSQSQNASKRNSLEQRQSIKTPKFGPFQKFDYNKLNKDSIVVSQEIKMGRQTFKEKLDGSRVKFTYSAGKSQRIINSINYVTPPPAEIKYSAKRKSQSSHQQSQVNEFSLIYNENEARKTVKKLHQQRQYSESSVSNSNSRHTVTQTHKNPAKQKTQSKTKGEQQKLTIPDSFRYCVGCEAPILSVNIKQHEKSCEFFRQLSVLSNNDLILRIRQKVQRIEGTISQKNTALEPQQIEQLKYSSSQLVKESRNRQKGIPESPKFKENYFNLMNLGNKWCASLQQINKLRWFSRILSKLQSQ